MFPVFKVFSLIIRVFSRPVVNYIKSIHKSNFKNLTGLSRFLVSLGNRHHRMEVWMNRKLMGLKTDSDMFTKPLSAEIALEKGIEFFYEIFFYSLIVGIAGYEMIKAHEQGEEKKAKDEKRLSAIEASLEQTIKQASEAQEHHLKSYGEMDANLKLIAEKLEKSLEFQAQQQLKEKEVREGLTHLHEMHLSMMRSVQTLESSRKR